MQKILEVGIKVYFVFITKIWLCKLVQIFRWIAQKTQREPNVAAWKGHNDSCLIIVIVSLGIYNYMNIEVHPSLPAYLSLRTSSPRFSPFSHLLCSTRWT